MDNWRGIPFVRFVLPLIVGILLHHYLPVNRTALFVGMLLVALFCLLISKKKFIYELRWVYGFSLNLTILLFGWWMASRSVTNHFQALLPSDFETTTLLVKINSKPITKNKIRVTASTINTSINGSTQPVNGNLLLYFDPTPESTQLQYGDLIQLKTAVRPIPPPANPDAFDFQQFMRYSNVEYQAFPKEQEWESVNENQGNMIHRYAYAFQDRLLDILNTKLKSDQEKIVAAALLLGDRSRITSDLKTAYAETGAMHVLAVSGLHVGLLFLVFSFLLNLVKVKHWFWKYLRTGLLLFAVWSFALVTGLAPSVVRAAAMLSFIIIGITIHRNGNIYNTIAGSAFVLLIIDPNYLYQVGFQLSYLALLGIIYFQPKFYRQFQFVNPILDKVWALITVSLSAQVLTFPISLYYFHQFPFYFWLSGIVVVPAATIILPLGIGLFIFGNIPLLGTVLAVLLERILWLMNVLVIGIQHLPFATTKGVWISFPIVLLLYAIILTITLALRKPNNKLQMLAGMLVGVFVMTSVYKTMQQQKQSFVTAYSFKDRSVLDFVHGTTAYSFSSVFLEDEQFQYAVSNHRNKNGVNHVIRFGLDKEGSFPGLTADNGVITFNNERYLIVNDAFQIPDTVAADYLVLCGLKALNVESLLQKNKFKAVVFDRACHWKSVKQWKAICDTNQQPYHDIRQSGYWQP